MRALFLVLCLAAQLAAVSAKKTILLSNDDSWASTYIRAVYRLLKEANYNVILVAPVSQRLGWAGKFDLPETKTLLTDGEFGYVKKGAPSWGKEENDKNIWYFNGTPSSCVAFALDYVIPQHFGNVNVDLTIGGVNEGPNLSAGFYTASGTMSAIYTSIYRGIPGISFSGLDFNNSFFKDQLNNDADNPANIYAKKVVDLTNRVLGNKTTLPKNTGLNVNFPKVGLLSSKKCTNPKWLNTRVTGSGIFMQDMTYDDKSDMVSWQVKYFDDIQTELTVGDINLPSEYSVYLADNCTTAVSAFTIDNDVSVTQNRQVQLLIGDLF